MMADGQEQIRLANIVKGLHGRLRRELRQANGDHEALWTKHCSDQPRLCKYAKAMHMLAEKHWTKNGPSDRVEWCYKTAVEFFRQGGLHSSMEKQRKRIQFAGAGRCCCCFITENNSGRCTRIVYPFTKETFLLLDVGSCFNPFSIYEDITAVAIDLQPAVESVYKCDFLRLNIEKPDGVSCSGKTPNHCSCFTKGVHDDHTQGTHMSTEAQNTCKQRIASENMDAHEQVSNASESASPADFPVQLSLLCNQDNLLNPTAISYSYLQPYLGGAEVTKLPSDSFHVVVFSLFLSYFPSPQQRWECCVKAHKLLVVNGLLLIVTPDSSHQNHNAPMMKSWKLALEAIGFVRWCYMKDTHLHCMGFRKVAPCHLICTHGDNVSPALLYIPQDYQEDEEESVFVNVPRTEKEDLEMCEFFTELPNFDD